MTNMAAVDYFLKLDGIEGESRDAKHRNEIEIESFSWGLHQTGDLSSGGGAGSGKAQLDDISFVAGTSKASPKLFLSCASGQHIKEALLTVRKAGEQQAEFYKLTLTDVLVSSYANGGADDDVPVDQFSLNFAKIEVAYYPQKDDGSLDAPVVAGWDLKGNIKA
jgi:type VI secretion system secreted protein Hcp